ncbi:hypothetical protein C5167_049468 [Papaver somniferum]|uniref:CDC20/Fizzy WD40 domain-containing protein n=2 Tax=Papaver somniferum TaxID=3469 RepID=A0A4Y7KMB8_PAPSO|nr:cell division cycle 20.1, cofactor of APC complex-like isoform X1 [Papaver somniferum]RZC73987.1 hypothetical protein C5167_049468 [Papaver somniferum]
MDFDYAHYMLMEARKGKENPVASSPAKEANRKQLAEALNLNRSRILAFKNKPPIPAESLLPETASVQQAKPTKPRRSIPQTSERTLDAPEIIDDYYLNLLDWGSSNVLKQQWSASGQQLASGGNDNLLHIWDRSVASSNSPTQWLHRLEDHTAAVKALAWCPFQANLLASGGGGGDRCIKFWNTHTGACLNSVDAGSQVCSLLWNKNERQLLSSHGFTQNQLTLWKYPSMVKIAELTGHTSRVLYMAQSPDGCTVASAAGDETLRFWNVFGTPELVKPATKANPEPFAHFNRIR